MKIFAILFMVAATVSGCTYRDMLNLRQGFYIWNYSKANFFEAHRFCRRFCTQLVSFKTSNEFLEFANGLNGMAGIDNATFWTSGTNVGMHDFYWFSTGAPIPFSNWDKEVNSDAEYVNHDQMECLKIEKNEENFILKAASCLEEHYFICLNDGA